MIFSTAVWMLEVTSGIILAQTAAFGLTGSGKEKMKQAIAIGLIYGKMDSKTLNKLNKQMKRLVTYILMIIFFFACNNPKPSSEKIIIFPDTTSIIQLQQQLEKSDTLIRELNIASITLQKQVDSLRCANDSI